MARDLWHNPLWQIEVDHVYRYVANAADPEGQSLSYSLVSGPEGMSVDPLTGIVTGLLFEDRNEDGVWQNDEPTIAVALVFLDANGNGFSDADERSTRSSAAGACRNRPPQCDFTTPDGFAGYQYARNNPVNFSDPSGRLTLTETLVVVRERLQQYKTDILRYKKALDTVTTRIGEVTQYVGGAMAAVAVFYPPHNISWALYTFGPKFFSGMFNTFDIARDMLGGANASYEISFGYNTATGKSAIAYYNRGVSEAQHSLGNKRFARFGLAPTFAFLGLGGVVRPMIPTGGLFGEPSMAGIMVHEFSHFSLNTKDADYLCQNVADARPTRGLASKVYSTDESLKNADNYRCYARAVTLAFEKLAAELLL